MANVQHRIQLEITAEAIDTMGHVNNVEYVRWMQDVALSHSGTVGCTAATQADGAAWVARSHHIEYLRPAFEGERIEVRTWVEGGRRASSVRHYEFVRLRDEVVLARGETEWVYVDAATGRPRSVPDAIRGLFPLEAP
jgi:acyl-CoA thioester hydrolase